MVRKRIVVAGAVQGVNFRETCRTVAAENGVGGWVRNLRDGRVEAVFEGPADTVDRVVAWAQCGPAAATVADFAVHLEQPEGLTSFVVR
ncbi:MAG TPA: acylphosphatase [Micromonosporaceae bacterium]|nr:acylphosphatase [Micromonosporaceae bacterium]